MVVHVFQHVAFEDVGSIRPRREHHGYKMAYTRFFAADCVPTLDGVELLIVRSSDRPCTPASVRDLVGHCGDELAAAPYVQSAEELLRVVSR